MGDMADYYLDCQDIYSTSYFHYEIKDYEYFFTVECNYNEDAINEFKKIDKKERNYNADTKRWSFLNKHKVEITDMLNQIEESVNSDYSY